jgi:chitodextrinase
MTGIAARATAAAVLVVLAFASLPAVAVAGWLPAVDISGEGELFGTEPEPRLAVGQNGAAVAVWQQVGINSWQVQASAKAPGGNWGPPTPLSTGDNALTPQVAMNNAGEAVAIWHELRNEGSLRAASMTPQGTWKSDPSLSASGGDLGSLDVAIDPTGRATAIWTAYDGQKSSTYSMEAASKPPGGSWEQPVHLTTDDHNAWSPQLDVDASGHVVAAWFHYVGEGNETAIEVSELDPGGEWSEPQAISGWGGKPIWPEVAVGGGRAVVVWKRGPIIESAYRNSGGAWQSPHELGEIGESEPDVAIDSGGNAVAVWGEDTEEGKIVDSATLAAGATAVWTGWNGKERVVEAASGTVLGGWDAPLIISPANSWSRSPQVGLDGEGDAAAVWRGESITKAAVFDVTAPDLNPVSIPSQGRAGSFIPFSSSPFDAWSQISPAAWTFGDGTGASGSNVSHAYENPGNYQVTVSTTDAAGHPVSASGFIDISPARAVGDRVAVVRNGRVNLGLLCPGVAPCRGSLTLTGREKGKGGGDRVRPIGNTVIAIAPSSKDTEGLKLARWSLKLLRSSRKHRLAAELTGDAVEPRAIVLKMAASARPGRRR